MEAQWGRALERDVKKFETEEKEEQRKRSIRMCEYSADLDRQLMEQTEKRMQAYKEFLLEKMAIDEIVRRIHEEDQRLVTSYRNHSTNYLLVKKRTFI